MKTRIYRYNGGWAFTAQYRRNAPLEGWSATRAGAVFGRSVLVGQAAREAAR